MEIFLAAIIVAVAIVVSGGRIVTGLKAAAGEERRRARQLSIAALFAPALSQVQDDPKALLAWQPLAKTLRVQFPQEFAALDTADANGVADTGLYLVSHGKTQVVARTGTFIPHIGTVAHVNSPSFLSPVPSSLQAGGIINDRGQIFFEVILTDGTGVLLVATPRG